MGRWIGTSTETLLGLVGYRGGDDGGRERGERGREGERERRREQGEGERGGLQEVRVRARTERIKEGERCGVVLCWKMCSWDVE